MANLALSWDFHVTLNGEEHVFASPSTPPSIALSVLKRNQFTLATATTIIPWAPNGSEATPSSFDFLYILSSQPIFAEFTCNDSDSNERVFALPIAANIPFVLGADDAFYNFTAGPAGDAFAGSLDVLDRLRLRNVSGSTATITLAVGKT